MKIEEAGNILTISDKPYLRWAIGAAVFLFSLLLMLIGISLLFRDSDYAVNTRIFVSGLIFGKFRIELVFRNETRPPIASRWQGLFKVKISIASGSEQVSLLITFECRKCSLPLTILIMLSSTNECPCSHVSFGL